MSIVNVIFYGDPTKADDWVLIDTGLPTSRNAIVETAEARFGRGARPSTIIVTHAHFDHAGSVEALAPYWDVPVHAHPLEFPYLNGQASYPPADAFVGGGAMALLSPLFPRSPVDIARWLKMLPPDQNVPGMPGWKWLHTPGHSPGHISSWLESDRPLIAGDAIVTRPRINLRGNDTKTRDAWATALFYARLGRSRALGCHAGCSGTGDYHHRARSPVTRRKCATASTS
jgi:glyoxylase-like metal-dependent hydrolase (beta-lactamase superfamily II)